MRSVCFVTACLIAASCGGEPTEVRPPGPDGEVLVADWDQGLGTGVNAFTDGRLFGEWGGGAESGGFEVMSTQAAGRAFSTPTFLRIRAISSWSGWTDMVAENAWAEPAVGERVELSFEIAWVHAASGATTHGIYFDDRFDGTNWGPQTLGLSIEDNATHWRFMVWTGVSTEGPYRVEERFPLLKNQVYVVRVWYDRLGSDRYMVGAEVADLAGTVIYRTEDFADCEWYYCENSLADVEFVMPGAGARGMRGLRLGNNGLDTQSSPVTDVADIANVRVRVITP